MATSTTALKQHFTTCGISAREARKGKEGWGDRVPLKSQCGIATQNNLKKERATIQKRSLNDSSLSSKRGRRTLQFDEGEDDCRRVFYLESGGITSADDVHHKLTAVFGRCL